MTNFVDLSGMFEHACGLITDADGAPVAQWAWGHEHAPAHCSDLHWWQWVTVEDTAARLSAPTPPQVLLPPRLCVGATVAARAARVPRYVNFERFEVRGEDAPCVYLIGWSVGDALLTFQDHDTMTIGQPYAYLRQTQDALHCSTMDVYNGERHVAQYQSSLIWMPNADGSWFLEEVFHWTTDIGAGCSFHGFSHHKPRQLFARQDALTIDWHGRVTQGAPLMTSHTWTW